MKAVTRREMLQVSVLTSVGTALAACAPTPTPTKAVPAEEPTQVPVQQATQVPAKPTAAEPVKIRATWWGGEPRVEEAFNQVLAAYQEKTTAALAVEWIDISSGGQWGRDKLQTMIAGGDAPDFMLLNTGQFEAVAARGQLLELDSFAQKDNFDLDIYWPQAVEGVKYDGKLYGLPRDISNHVLFYNKDLLDEAGVAYPTKDWTWDDLLTAAQTLTKDKNGDGKTDQWGFGISNGVWMWGGFVMANDGQVLSSDRTQCRLTDPAAVEALEFYFGLQNEYHVSPPPGALPEQGWALDWMISQSVAMSVFGPWARPNLVAMEQPFHWDVAYPPQSPKTGKSGTTIYTDMWGVFSGTKNPEATWEFLKYLTGEQGQDLLVQLLGGRSMTPVKAVAQTDAWLHYGDSAGEVFIECLSIADPPPTNFRAGMEVEVVWDQEWGLVIAEQETVAQAAANICEKIAPVLAGTS